MPLRDAARSACLSHAFLRSWRYHPTLTLDRNILGSRQKNWSSKIDHILRNHSGIGIKTLRLDLCGISDACQYLDSWLQIAVTPGIEELTLVVPELGPLRNLRSLCLYSVHISGDELEWFLSNSLALEVLDLSGCKEIICLKIPSELQQLHYLNVVDCYRLRILESKARNLYSFSLRGHTVKLSLGETLQMKRLWMSRENFVYHARAELPSSMPNLERLRIGSGHESLNAPMLPTKFLFLKHLTICLMNTGETYDYFSLVSFLDASPSLETLLLNVLEEEMKNESVFGGSSNLRQIPEQRHCNLKCVEIVGFSSAKSLVELTCYILKNAESLECLTLNTLYGTRRCYSGNLDVCDTVGEEFLREAPRAVAAIKTCIMDKVPSTVKLTVFEPCSRCHTDVIFEVL
ncbi:hypothetical protein ACP4OV_018542 [Aristida adscensionis]